LFWIPSGFSGDKGVYVEYPAEELYAILSVESHRHQAGIVGENLGTLPRAVNASMKRHNILQMYVVQYALEEADPKRTWRSLPSNMVAGLNTHDMPPFRAYFEGLDIEDRLDLKFLDKASARQERQRRARIKKILIELLKDEKLLPGGKRADPKAVFQAVLEHLASSKASIVLVNIEDLWGEILPQNVPSTTQDERPNWRRRMRLGIEEIEGSEDMAAILRLVDSKRKQR